MREQKEKIIIVRDITEATFTELINWRDRLKYKRDLKNKNNLAIIKAELSRRNSEYARRNEAESAGNSGTPLDLCK